ncbi:F-actin-uncapping protein LRRC16A-like isoform X2 [Liolophura sinensis]|uniref:F-actin-uncapping protein LRRC16A-like isoform X2 n=1 Tax=Liolophura sinensis TaxID=3198878 RepID=UPI00315870F8
MAAVSNIPREIQDSMRDVLDRRIKLSIKRMVRQEVRADKVENKILAFAACRLFVLSAKVPTKVDFSVHYLDIQAIESRRLNQLSLSVGDKTHVFCSLETDTEEINHMIIHIGTSLKQIFPSFPLERLIKRIEVTPQERLKVMYDMMKGIEKKDVGPCGGFSHMYACMCDYHLLPYREEVAWDVDTIYLSQDSKELCLKDFDHLEGRDLVPVISALEHNSWFTKLNINNVKLVPEAHGEILKVMKKNAVLSELHMTNTGIKVDFVQKLSTALLSNGGSQLTKLDLSNNLLEDRGLLHLTGALVKLSKGLTYLNLAKTGLTGKGIGKLAEALTSNKSMPGSLQTLILADNSMKGDDSAAQSLFNFLAQPNTISHLDLSNTDVPLDGLCGALLRGCCQNIGHLNLANNTFTQKKTKETIIPSSWKKFFASAYSLQWLNLSGNKLPPEVIKELLLGISSNVTVNSMHLDLSSNEMKTAGARHLEGCISNNNNITSLDISDNGLEQDLCSLLAWIQQNRGLTKLSIGRNFSGLKSKQIGILLESVVQMIQDEESILETLSLADSKLRGDTAMVINALGSNTSLTELDISGNHMGDFGARMLAKALQINTKLRTVYWDKNSTTIQGFEDIAAALEKNYTLKKMPVPVNDTVAALKLHPERMETAVQQIEAFLQRNHSPRKFASDQAYRLQQGFLISSTQQLVDRLVVQVQDTMNALALGSVEGIQGDLDRASDLIKDAEKSRQILPRLQEIAIQSQNTGNPVQAKLTTMAKELKDVLERHLQWTVHDMLKSADSQCVTIMADQEFHSRLNEESKKRSTLPPNFAKYLLDGVETDVINKLSECNLSVAAHVSDSVMDEVIDNLSKSHKTLTNHLNVQKSTNKKETRTTKETKNEVNVITITEEDKEPPKSESSTLAVKRKSLCQMRKKRPQSVVDWNHEVDKNDLSWDEGKKALGEDADLPTNRDEDEKESLKSILDAPSSGAMESLEIKGFNSEGKDGLEDTPVRKPEERVDIASFDALPGMSDAPKLIHVSKARPKRVKAHAVTRPTAKPINLVEDEDLQVPNTNSFFESKPVEGVPPMARTISKTDENENEKTSASSSKPEKKKWSPFSSKDKEKDRDKKEKTSSGKGFTIASFFSKKQPSGSQSKPKEAEKSLSDEVKVEKKASFSESTKSNGPVSREKKAEPVKPVETETKSLSPAATSEVPEKSPPPYTGPKLPSGRGRLLIGGNLMEEMKRKRLSTNPAKTAELSRENKTGNFADAEPKPSGDDPKGDQTSSSETKPVEPKAESPQPQTQPPPLPKSLGTKRENSADAKLVKGLPKEPLSSAEPPKTPEHTFKVFADASKIVTVTPKTVGASPRSSVDSPQSQHDVPKGPEDTPKTSTEVPKTPPDQPKSDPPTTPESAPKSTEPKGESGSNVLPEPAQANMSQRSKPEEENIAEPPKPKSTVPQRPVPKPRARPPPPVTEEKTSTTSVLPKRTVAAKPTPPPVSSKPKPMLPSKPRSTVSQKNSSDESNKLKDALNKVEPAPASSSTPSGIVYDSSTLRLSVKGKIKKLGLEKKIVEDETEKGKAPIEPSKRASSEPREGPPTTNDQTADPKAGHLAVLCSVELCGSTQCCMVKYRCLSSTVFNGEKTVL